MSPSTIAALVRTNEGPHRRRSRIHVYAFPDVSVLYRVVEIDAYHLNITLDLSVGLPTNTHGDRPKTTLFLCDQTRRGYWRYVRCDI